MVNIQVTKKLKHKVSEVVKKFFNFLKEAKEELKKVAWPSQDEVTKYTVVTVITVAFFSILLWLVDSLLMQIIQVVMN